MRAPRPSKHVSPLGVPVCRRIACVVLLALAGLALSGVPADASRSHRAPPRRTVRADSSIPSVSSQPVLGMPATDVEVIGASPGEASGEAWAQGQVGPVPVTVDGQSISDQEVLMRYTDAAGTWQVVPVDSASGAAISVDWVASEVTSGGGVALLGDDTNGNQELVTRNPGGAFATAPTPSSTVLLPGESLYSGSTPPTMATIDETSGTGVLIAPADESSADPGVLHYADGSWTREPICASLTGSVCVAPKSLTVAAVSASSAGNAWLLGETTVGGHQSAPLLFRRESGPGSTPVWVEQHPSSFLFGSGSAPGGESVALPTSGPLITASGTGVWVDLAVAGAADATTFVSPGAGDEIAGTWCYPTSLCPGSGSLGGDLPANYGSTAWPASDPSAPGERIITGLNEAAELVLPAGASSFSYETTAGDAQGAPGGGGTFGPGGETLTTEGSTVTGGAAFDSPSSGWLGTALLASLSSPVRQTPEVVQVTTSPASDPLTSFPVPFRYPVLAVAGQPGEPAGSAGSEALAVGTDGEVARYHPGQGWVQEFLYNSEGQVSTPTLRGVAWPNSEFAFAVGDDGAMWRWNSQTGLWEPDPAKPLNFEGNLTAIAFDPNDPDIGYAVGKQGVLLAYGKSWTQEAIPASLDQANFTSVAFAGNEAIVGYRMLEPNSDQEEGGIIVNDGSGWVIDPSAASLLGTLPAQDTVISKVAGLPDGGAVAAGPGVVLERDPGSSSWHFTSSPLADSSAGNISALAAFQSGSSVRALISVDDDPESDPSGNDNSLYQEIDNPPAVATGQPPLLIGPDPLPSHGFLVEQTADGWSDLEHDDFPNQSPGGEGDLDLPVSPDPVLALLVNSTATQGWAVGGETGGAELQLRGAGGSAAAVQTAGLQHLGGGVTPPVSDHAPLSAPSGEVTVALGGGSGCVQACAANQAQSPGPNRWLSGALTHASAISGLGAFVYVGEPLSSSVAAGLSGSAYDRELADFDTALGSGGSLPVYAAASPGEETTASGGATGLAQALGSHLPAGEAPAGSPAPPAGTDAYAFDTSGSSGGKVRVIVLDFSAGSLSGSGQLGWLVSQLANAQSDHIPAIVVGADPLNDPGDPDEASDASAVSSALVSGGASAYLFYDDEQQNVAQTIGHGSSAIPAYGTGTLGYVDPPTNEAEAADFLGASGYLLVSVDVAERSTRTNVAPVSVKLIPNAGSLALDAVGGTLLRRSTVSLFEGLARRPDGGEEYIGGSAGSELEAPDPYTTLPETCLGSDCDEFIAPQYTFTSSNPKVGTFVEHDPASTDPTAILQNSSGAPIPDSSSGLFCAFNPGTTTVTISAGGLSYSEQVTVEAGSVEEPCGTVPTTTTTPPGTNPGTPFPNPVGPTPAPTPRIPSPAAPHLPAAVQPPATVTKVATPATHPPLVLPFSEPAAVPPRALFPVSTLTPRPTPPSGFSSVSATAPVSSRVTEEEREEEEAVETSQAFAAYHSSSPNPVLPAIVVLVLVLAAGSGGARLRSRRARRGPAFAAAWSSESGVRDRRSRRRAPW